jgi:hypothetical protein
METSAKLLAGGRGGQHCMAFAVPVQADGSRDRLTGNLTVPNEDTSVVQITAEGVTLDLNGFVIQGPSTEAGPNGTGTGVQGLSSTVVVNGTVRGASLRLCEHLARGLPRL